MMLCPADILLGINGGSLLFAGRKDSMILKLMRTWRKQQHRAFTVGKRLRVHQMLGIVVVVAHASEITRVISHISWWHLAIAAVLFSVWLITEKGLTEHIA